MKALEFDYKPRGGFGIGLSMKVQSSAPHPIKYYREKQLETHVVCESCTLRYAIYGVFGWCPDCGAHNSLQILGKNLELAAKELALSGSVDDELAKYLVNDALENVVSAVDGFGREVCLQKGREIRFQNLPGAQKNVLQHFGFDFSDGVDPADWSMLSRIFQKRHLIAHKLGVMDEDYVQKANDPSTLAGRIVHIDPQEVTLATQLIKALGERLFRGLNPTT